MARGAHLLAPAPQAEPDPRCYLRDIPQGHRELRPGDCRERDPRLDPRDHLPARPPAPKLGDCFRRGRRHARAHDPSPPPGAEEDRALIPSAKWTVSRGGPDGSRGEADGSESETDVRNMLRMV